MERPTNQPITIEKLFEMFGRVSLERDLMRMQIEQLQQEMATLKNHQHQGETTDE